MSKEANGKTFESQLAELESLVDAMENGELSLEDSLKSFEKGIQLTRSCQQSLSKAELKVKTLLSNDDVLSDFKE